MGALGGKAAVVTGGSRGIGRAIVLRLAEEGVSVAFSFVRDQRAADEVVAAAQAAGVQAVAVQADQMMWSRNARRAAMVRAASAGMW
jgi:3-oxoacyl-[acyl-carrier protein] reductase